MPWNPDGTFTRDNGEHTGNDVWQQDDDAGYKIVDELHDVHDEDLALGIAKCLNLDGYNTMLANLKMGGFKVTGLGTPTAAADAATKAYVDSVASFNRRYIQVQYDGIIWFGSLLDENLNYTVPNASPNNGFTAGATGSISRPGGDDIQVGADGVYQMSLELSGASIGGTATGSVGVIAYVNGVQVATAGSVLPAFVSGAPNISASRSIILSLTAGDRIDVQMRGETTGSNANSSFVAHLGLTQVN